MSNTKEMEPHRDDDYIEEFPDGIEEIYGEEIEDEDDGGNGVTPPDDGGKRSGKPSPLGVFLRLFIGPRAAWKRLKGSGLKSEEVGARLFTPLLALTSLGAFARAIYEEGVSLSAMLSEAIGIFIAFFFGYYILLIICRHFLPGDAKEKIDTPYGRNLLMMLISTLSLYLLISEVFPPIGPVVVFAPLFTVYAALRGVPFLRLKSASESITAWSIAIMSVAVPYALYSIFSLLLPSAAIQ